PWADSCYAETPIRDFPNGLLARIIHESSYQGFADPALRFDDRGGRQFPVAQVTARFRFFYVLG
ncbi:hypothetical protein, partial [Sphingomonas sp. 10B4]|uniref:hypothetical protein n=1 Tax=Sphingomonas sp. 10B4 TaxID=3048575 RepID=UPI002B2384E5